MRSQIGGFAGRTHHIVGNLMLRLNYLESANRNIKKIFLFSLKRRNEQIMAAHHGHTLIINTFQSSQTSINTSHVIGNSVVWVRYQVQLKPIHTKTSLHLEQLDLGSRTVLLSK